MENFESTFQKINHDQKKFYHSGKTKSLAFRLEMLDKLKAAILDFEPQLALALKKDLGKSDYEVMTTEVGFSLTEIATLKKGLSKWMRPKKVRGNLISFGAKSSIYPEPYGNTLIIGPWNYPFQLVIAPLAGAIAAGNTAIVKPSELAPFTAKVVSDLVAATFPREYIAVLEGGIPETQTLLGHPFDLIFFTGSPKVGKIVMKAAAEHLTPVVLELGGKSPCIVDKSAKLDLAARRILFGKGTNAGQTCIAPDYLLVHSEVKEAFVKAFIAEANKIYGSNLLDNPDFGKIINDANFDRVAKFIDEGVVLYGGGTNKGARHIDITLLEVSNLDAAVMREEIFGPVLPILTYTTFDEILSVVGENPNPLACYVFTEDSAFEAAVVARIHFGGSAINDTIMHIANEHLPFGGRGPSGHGRYHGYYSFEAFSHFKSVLKSPTYFDLALKYPPYKASFIPWVKRLLYK